MTISDDPDEDANSLDDEALLDTFLVPDAPPHAVKADLASDMMDWPPPGADDDELAPEDATLEWFKTNHTDWFGQIEAVLRAWVASHQNESGRDAGSATS